MKELKIETSGILYRNLKTFELIFIEEETALKKKLK